MEAQRVAELKRKMIEKMMSMSIKNLKVKKSAETRLTDASDQVPKLQSSSFLKNSG